MLLADDVRNTGETFARCAALVHEAGGTVVATVEIYDRCEANIDLGVANIALAEVQGAGKLQGGRLSAVREQRPDHQILKPAAVRLQMSRLKPVLDQLYASFN